MPYGRFGVQWHPVPTTAGMFGTHNGGHAFSVPTTVGMRPHYGGFPPCVASDACRRPIGPDAAGGGGTPATLMGAARATTAPRPPPKRGKRRRS